jgi:hypothetical protein
MPRWIEASSRAALRATEPSFDGWCPSRNGNTMQGPSSLSIARGPCSEGTAWMHVRSTVAAAAATSSHQVRSLTVRQVGKRWTNRSPSGDGTRHPMESSPDHVPTAVFRSRPK